MRSFFYWLIVGIVCGGIIAARHVGGFVVGTVVGGVIGGFIGTLAIVGQWRETHRPTWRLVGSLVSIAAYFLFIGPLLSAWLGANDAPPNQNAMVITFLITLAWTTVALIIAIDAAVWLIVRRIRSHADPQS